jgi:SAM-dependent methyltransferase
MTKPEDGGTGRASSTEGYYAENAGPLAARYESLTFEQVHRDVLHLIPQEAVLALDIGAGSGRDAAALAKRGHKVVAVEPTAALREHGMRAHGTTRIEWVDDSLPDLLQLRARSERFDLVMATAVWMHMDVGQRRQSMRHVAELLRHGGLFFVSLRHGPVQEGRRMFDVSGDETVTLGREHGLSLVHRNKREDMQNRPDVRWTCVVLRRGLAR